MVDRYSPDRSKDPFADCELYSDGDYVLYTEYEILQHKNAELQAEVELWKERNRASTKLAVIYMQKCGCFDGILDAVACADIAIDELVEIAQKGQRLAETEEE